MRFLSVAAPVLAAALLLPGCLEGGLSDAAGDGEGVTPGPEWRFTDTDGHVHDRDRYLGAPVVVFVMATWCSSCKAEAPRVKAAYEALAEENVTFLSVSFDPRESDEALDAWADARDQPWPHGVDEGQALSRTFGVHTQSTVLVLDTAGQLVLREYSPSSEAIVAAVHAASA